MAKKTKKISQKEMLDRFNKTAMLTKEDVLLHIRYTIRQFEREAQISDRHTPRYYRRIIELLQEFRVEVENAVLLDDTPLLKKLDEGWHYAVELLDTGFTLYLSHVSQAEYTGDVPEFVDTDASYILVRVKSRRLSIGEFAEMNGISSGAVRQWIRRGKLNSAIKEGGEWHIPEFAKVRGRVYEAARYEWGDELAELPDEYKFLKGCRSVWISQNVPDKKMFSVSLSKREGEAGSAQTKVVKMDTKEKEKFELFLIGHPQVRTRTQEIRALG